MKLANSLKNSREVYFKKPIYNINNMSYFILYIVALSILIIILATINSKKQQVALAEGFEASYRPIHLQPYADKYYTKQNVNPMESLPVDYQEIEYRNSSNSDRHYAIDNNNQSNYCKEHPNCYPCPGWKLSIGNPMCN